MVNLLLGPGLTLAASGLIISTDEKIIQSYLKKLINNIRIFDSVIFDEKFKTLIQMKIDGIIEKKNSRNSY